MIDNKKKWVFVAIVMAALASGCASTSSEKSATVRICDDTGCSDRPRDSSTFSAAPTAAEQEENKRYQALAEKAETDSKAAFDLALRLYRGDGFKRNTYQAITWMREAGDMGNAEAQLALGRIYLSGLEETGPDPAEAESWLLRASDQGNAEAKKLLKEAQQAKREEIEYQRWLQANRLYWRSYWISGYHYGTCWRGYSWIYC